MTDKPMSHAEIVRKAAAALEWEGISDELCPDLERIAKRLEEEVARKKAEHEIATEDWRRGGHPGRKDY